MGLLRAEIVEIAKIVDEMVEPSILLLGKQDIYADLDDIRNLMKEYGICFDYVEDSADNSIDSYKLFYALGAKEVSALDCSDYEGANILLDLNVENAVPAELQNHFDLVIDGGVLEHIFKVETAIKNINSLVKKNGFIYHMLPCAGLINHGFYSFSPTFFIDYYSKPEWRIKNIRMQYKPQRGIYKFVFYSMDCRLFLSQDGFNKYVSDYWNCGGEILIQCICQKKQEDSLEEVPMQGLYKNKEGWM